MNHRPPGEQEEDARWMQRALDCAAQGRLTARPNPMVGAVIVRDGELVATGFHVRAGLGHAEAVALGAAGEAARGATVYVNLEPCSHHGRTPPCADALIRAGVARVVCGMIDPNPRVSGRGVARLREAGIEVVVGVLREACERLNEDFLVTMTHGRPFVTLKLAMSMDGRIATASGDSQWLSSPASRTWVHDLREAAGAVLVGTGTLVTDNPALTARDGIVLRAHQPQRWVLDASLRAPLDLQVYRGTGGPTVVVCREDADAERRAALRGLGIEVWSAPVRADGRVEVREVLAEMARRGLLSVLVEGGGALAGDLFDADLVDRAHFVYAPLVLGGADARPAIGGVGAARVADAHRALAVRWWESGPDRIASMEFRRPFPGVPPREGGRDACADTAEGDPEGTCSPG